MSARSSGASDGERDATGGRSVVLFDGVCNLCVGSVRLIARRDPRGRFAFASLQSEVAKELLARHAGGVARPDSLALIEDGRLYWRSDAALRIARGLSGLWPLLGVFLIVPRFVRDGVYRFVAARRYRWFGKRDACMVATEELRARFLE